jgi:hypothetical protein
VLVIIFLQADQEWGNTVLNNFNTQQACAIERNRIGFDMADAYPYSMDFRIECRCPTCLRRVA